MRPPPVGETGAGRLFVGIDPILRRHVWIHEVAPGTPPVDATRRDVSRPGRLYWLAGRRSATENWDAFEAPRGEPFLTAPPTSDWRQVHRALSSLATELDASAHEDRHTRLSLADVWRRPDGQLVLLDFPWPALVTPDAVQPLHPIELLATIYHAVGINPNTIVYNHLNQPRELVKADPVTKLFG